MPSHPPGELRIEPDGDSVRAVLRGAWTLPSMVALKRAVECASLEAGGTLTVDGSELEALDTTGVWVVRALVSRAEDAGNSVQLVGMRDDYLSLIELVDRRMEPVKAIAKPEHQNLLERVGRAVTAQAQDLLGLLAFIGEATVAFLRQLRQPRRIRWRMTAKIVEESGLNALPIAGLLVFLLGIVVAYQGGRQLETYGANIFVVEMVGLIMLRELSPLIVAIIVAGRTGSAYTAEIGTMRVTEEIDAMETIGIGPFDQLVLPKVVGLVIALPLLTVFADIMGIFGGMVMASNVLQVSFVDFLQRMPQAISVSDFVVGIVKAPVFALIISMVGCHQGFQVRGGADSVGRQTTVSVVQSIFLVIISDACFSVLFSWLGI